MKPLMNLDKDQALACFPEAQIWVNANAGTGKTTVLTSRVLRLLLAGTPPSKILCLTYTKVAASEMQNRVIDRLRYWVTLETKALEAELESLTGVFPSSATIKRARGLFIDVLENAEGLNIHTIHAFAQSLLRKFPIEAGVSPYFQIIDEQESKSVADRAMRTTIYELMQGKRPEIAAYAAWLIKETSDKSLVSLLQNALQDALKWQMLIKSTGSLKNFRQQLAPAYGVEAHTTIEDLTAEFIRTSDEDKAAIRAVLAVIANTEKKAKYVLTLQAALSMRLDNSLLDNEHLNQYLRAFLKADSATINSNVEKLKDLPDMPDYLKREMERCRDYVLQKAALYAFEKTVSYYALVQVMLDHHDVLTKQLGVLDYQQLLTKAEQLLTTASHQTAWVMYKLDGGLEHILVDEAQDTSPAQWRIIKALTQEFFVGETKSDTLRTLFVVGDEKQSIFSFQGADVQEFNRMKAWFEEKSSFSQQQLNTILLSKSYRSSKRVIEAVNLTTDKLGFSGVHLTKDSAALGKVTLWPVVHYKDLQTDEKGEVNEQEDSEEQGNQAVQVLLGKKLAKVITEWLKQGKIIESEQRRIRPEDIMILVPRRSSLVDTLTRELKRAGIPVQGIDNMILNEQLVVQDMLAFGRWLTLPEDDYALACVLRSPIGGISEDQLFSLAYGRKESLWRALENDDSHTHEFGNTPQLLKEFLNTVDLIDPYTLFFKLLVEHKIMQKYKQRMGVEAVGVLEEFLNQIKAYQARFPASMQGVLQFIEQQNIQVKRNSAELQAVRIMTVHGAKGLEAPVVIMADSADARKPRQDILWTELNGTWFPLYLPKSEFRGERLQRTVNAALQLDTAEYHRKLYVAMTRAKDELYITGYCTKNSDYQNSWHILLKDVLQNVAEYPSEISTSKETLEKQSQAVVAHPAVEAFSDDDDVLDFLKNQHSIPVRPITQKTQASMLSEVAYEPTQSQRIIDAQQFGILFHHTMRILFSMNQGDISDSHVEIAIESFITSPSNEIKLALKHQITGLVKADKTSFIFKKAQRLVEAAMSGALEIENNTIHIAAQVDLCVIHEQQIWVIDFKTSASVPSSLQHTPKQYLRQLAIYHHYIAKIFPQHIVRAALIWSNTAYFQEIPDAYLTAELLDVMKAKA